MECISPIFVRKTGIHVRCGKCLPCLQQRQKEWATRLSVEFRHSDTAYFITLTYKDNSITKLDKSQIQRFLKRLRDVDYRGIPTHYKGKKVSKINEKTVQIKYFTVGEYGSINNRPHWHILLFNYPYNHEDTENIINFLWSENGESLGFDKVGIVRAGAIEYVTGYMFKNQGKECIRLISKGIGKKYVNEKTISYHQKQLSGTLTIEGQKKPMPRYYSQMVFNERQRKEIGEKKINHIFEENLKDPYKRDRDYKQLINQVKFKNQKR